METHLIHTFLDDKIPFCEYFIIPYVLWYFVVIGSVLYFALGNTGKKEYYQYMATLAVGMTIFPDRFLCISQRTGFEAESYRRQYLYSGSTVFVPD